MDDAKVWERLGELTANSKSAHNQRKALFEMTREIKDSIAELTTLVSTRITAHEARIAQVETEQSDQKDDISSMKKFRNRIYIGLAGAGGTGGLGALLNKFGFTGGSGP